MEMSWLRKIQFYDKHPKFRCFIKYVSFQTQIFYHDIYIF